MAKRRPLLSALSIGCAVLMASPSWAAVVVEPGDGDLTINRGQGFKLATSRINANVGDSVMVGPGGAATVTYDDGCKVNVQPGAVTTIASLSPCASGSNAQDRWDWCRTHPDQTCGWTPETIAFWAAFLGMGAFIGWEISQNQGNGPTFRPGSP
jgi:hypothetical protein